MKTLRSRLALLGAMACAALAQLTTERFHVDAAEWVQANLEDAANFSCR